MPFRRTETPAMPLHPLPDRTLQITKRASLDYTRKVGKLASEIIELDVLVANGAHRLLFESRSPSKLIEWIDIVVW